jgi:hypothetical protein
MFYSWIWESPETLLGIATSSGITIQTSDGEEYTADMISFGFLIIRFDFLINKVYK